MINRSRVFSIVFIVLAAFGTAKGQNPVTDWNNIAITAALAASQVGPRPARIVSPARSFILRMCILAVYDAVNAIDHPVSVLRPRHFSASGRLQRGRNHRGGVIGCFCTCSPISRQR